MTLPSASNFVKLLNSLTGSTHRGLDFFEFHDIAERKRGEEERVMLESQDIQTQKGDKKDTFPAYQRGY